ncbi:nucleotidyltransferase domain-containing protein [Bacillus sp. DTU_2020_1000418_1_SI_GHA_SEK_038]|uniref:nucleotidyltransferase domain-containing protein n=1 Tax=Bacillus sp. DTU_2020_1000418_1_SI_GHA_SEK_038 TaxID=3077585 RepID=UPI0028E8DA71|nr:nucleotidyltransferase domain-containing protein [Bacillus sp. DTU_2020_1000418_1_SI_GHA_SEK_038]WNS73628.1 nucleotidyltransferase domain-containing protein [Bacillus sp. DTU_2020_1000418_1_SI_GHA_SEK_038]
MLDHIEQVIHQLEVDYDIKVLYACEAGSRAWGFPSKVSDYDVRFIYVHRMDWYLSIDQQRDTIEIPNRDAVSIPIDDQLDLSGWELTKALRLLRKSNPSLFEWLHSSIIYHQSYSTIDRMRLIAQNAFLPVIGVNHYVKMAKGNFRDCLKRIERKNKKYINVLRPLLAAKWIETFQTIPPVNFHILLDMLISPGELADEVVKIIQYKMNGEEFGADLNIDILHSFILAEIEHLEGFAKKIHRDGPNPTNELNQLFRDILKETWE